MHILLDLDGTVLNFIKSALKAHNIDYEETLKNWPLGSWHLAEDVLKMDRELFFEKIVNDKTFWTDMELLPWGDELYNKLSRLAPVVFCSSPSYDPFSASGKIQRLLAWKGYNFRDYIITPQKHVLAGSGNVLVDDAEKNINRFRNAGGKAVLFPSITNSNYHLADNPVNYTVEMVRNHLMTK